jgi:hypothetical protein
MDQLDSEMDHLLVEAETAELVDEIDRAIVYARDDTGLNPAIRQAFIDALLDKRIRAVSDPLSER